MLSQQTSEEFVLAVEHMPPRHIELSAAQRAGLHDLLRSLHDSIFRGDGQGAALIARFAAGLCRGTA